MLKGNYQKTTVLLTKQVFSSPSLLKVWSFHGLEGIVWKKGSSLHALGMTARGHSRQTQMEMRVGTGRTHRGQS
jgi:hypothetical protein